LPTVSSTQCKPTKTSTVTNPVLSAHDLQITKTVEPAGNVAPDQVQTYTLSWSVTGNEPAPNVTLSDLIPANTSYVAASCSNACSGPTPAGVEPGDTETRQARAMERELSGCTVNPLDQGRGREQREHRRQQRSDEAREHGDEWGGKRPRSSTNHQDSDASGCCCRLA
jgi:uncharacterized repeat protein (TIGR01451 family)